MKLAVVFLLIGAAMALPQNFFWSFGSGRPYYSANEQRAGTGENYLPPAVYARNQLKIPDLRFYSDEDEYSPLAQIDPFAVSNGEDQLTQPRNRIGSSQRFLLAPLLNQLFLPAVTPTVAAPSISLRTVIVTSTCIPFDHFFREPKNTTPCGVANLAARKKKSVEDLNEQEILDASPVEAVESSAVPELERSPRDLIESSVGESELGSFRRGKYFGINNHPLIVTVPNFVITQTQVVSVKVTMATGVNNVPGYLTCLPNSYFVC